MGDKNKLDKPDDTNQSRTHQDRTHQDIKAATKGRRYRFHFYPIAFVFTVLGVLILLALGTWQVQRRAWKLDLIEAVELRSTGVPKNVGELNALREKGADVRYSVVQVSGEYDHAREAHVFGTLGPTAGYYIFTPLINTNKADDKLIYINRGFVPQDFKAVDSRLDGQVTGRVNVTGLLREVEPVKGMAKFFPLTPQPTKNIWYSRTPKKFADYQFGDSTKTLSWYIDSHGNESTALYPRGNVTKVDFNNRHLEYALTWYGLALTLMGVWVAYSFRKAP